MKRLHIHVSVPDLPAAISFYSDLFEAGPCCAGANYANWRIDDPPVNFAASIKHGPKGVLHLGFEVETSDNLRAVDRVLHGPSRAAAALPWEVSMRRQPARGV